MNTINSLDSPCEILFINFEWEIKFCIDFPSDHFCHCFYLSYMIKESISSGILESCYIIRLLKLSFQNVEKYNTSMKL